jgi:hypothetical protein
MLVVASFNVITMVTIVLLSHKDNIPLTADDHQANNIACYVDRLLG